MNAVPPSFTAWAASDACAAPPSPMHVRDDGILDGPVNAARDRALLAAQATGGQAPVLRFHRHHPTASIGRLQALAREIRLPYCAEAGVAVVRRVTGGGALYLDPGQACFSLAAPSAMLGATLAERMRRGAEAVQEGLARLGVATVFKAPNDLETADHRKIASLFAAEQGAATLLFATVLVDLDITAALAALLVPTEKLTRTGLESARERMTGVAEQLGRTPSVHEVTEALTAGVTHVFGLHALAVPPEPAALAPLPSNQLSALDDWLADNEAFETADKVEGATLRLRLSFDREGKVCGARFALDGHLNPPDLVDGLSAALMGQPAVALASAARIWLKQQPCDSVGVTPDDLVRLIERAVDKLSLQDALGLSTPETSRLMLAGNGADAAAALQRASVMLVPYCAKPNWCKWRHDSDCVECGKCAVGDAYAMARERNMEVVTITNFEHLSETFGRMQEQGVSAYVGMCCGEFFLKRHHAFRKASMDGVLLDIEGATCYELKQEQLAYAGVFKAEARLDLTLVDKVMAQVPPCASKPQLTDPSPRRSKARRPRKLGRGDRKTSPA